MKVSEKDKQIIKETIDFDSFIGILFQPLYEEKDYEINGKKGINRRVIGVRVNYRFKDYDFYYSFVQDAKTGQSEVRLTYFEN